jgi:hypothetical protein
MRLSYGDATDLYRINLGWANQRGNQPPGFARPGARLLVAQPGRRRGPGRRRRKGEVIQRVVPYVKDTKNALVMRFEPPRSVPEMASLQAAFKEAIQKHFQLEPRELACEPCPRPKERKEILFYEASEGGAGVLRQSSKTRRHAAAGPRALEICHFDPDTLTRRAEDLRQGLLRVPARLRQPAGPQGPRPLSHPRPAGRAFAPSAARRRRRLARRAHGSAAQALRQPARKRWLDLWTSSCCARRATPVPDRILLHAAGFLLPRAQRRDLYRRPAARRAGADPRGRGHHARLMERATSSSASTTRRTGEIFRKHPDIFGVRT